MGDKINKNLIKLFDIYPSQKPIDGIMMRKRIQIRKKQTHIFQKGRGGHLPVRLTP